MGTRKKVKSNATVATGRAVGNQLRERANRTYKDGIFRTLFNDKEKLIELYNALEGTHFGLDIPLEFQTLEDAIYKNLKNDIAFTIDGKYIIFIKHQSTDNPNLPLRLLEYSTKTLGNMVKDREVYSTRKIKLPFPEFYMFYNGVKSFPEEWEMKLSDLYPVKEKGAFLELKVRAINVNYERGAALLMKCKTLQEYSQFVHLVRKHLSVTKDLAEALRVCIPICMEQGILKEFLKRHGTEVQNMLRVEISEEEYRAIREEGAYENGYEDGMEKGLEKGIEQGKAEERMKVEMERELRLKAEARIRELEAQLAPRIPPAYGTER